MKRFLVLDPHQVAELENLLDREDRVKIHRRLQFLKMRHEGKKNSEIQKILGVSSDTLSNWLTLFLSAGFSGILELQYEGRRPGNLELKKEEIRAHLKKNLVPNLTALKDWIEKDLSISVQTSWLGEWCKKNSIFLTRK